MDRKEMFESFLASRQATGSSDGHNPRLCGIPIPFMSALPILPRQNLHTPKEKVDIPLECMHEIEKTTHLVLLALLPPGIRRRAHSAHAHVGGSV
jgi:hypothetical protein